MLLLLEVLLLSGVYGAAADLLLLLNHAMPMFNTDADTQVCC